MMKQHHTFSHSRYSTPSKQRGVILFIALVALVTLMLAAIALVRTVDTSTVVAGNLAFKQAATTSGDGGYEQAIKWLTATDAANSGIDQWASGNAHPFNVNNAALGYYVNVDPAFDLAASSTWTSGNSADGGTDASGNAIRYVIQRMCRDTTAYLTEGNCLFSDAEGGPANHEIKPYGPAGAQVGGKNVLFRITVRVTGPRNSISYIQGFTY